MALTPRLELRQSQTLVMTPQLQQAIKLLQLSNLDLNAYVEEELERNPLLERDDSQSSDRRESEDDASTRRETLDQINDESAPAGADGEAPAEPATIDLALAGDSTAAKDAAGSLDVDYDNIFTNDAPADAAPESRADSFQDLNTWQSTRMSSGGFNNDDANLEQMLSNSVTLKDHLLEQLSIAFQDPAEKIIGLNLLDLVDEAGYVREGMESIGERLSCSVEKVEAVLEIMQGFDPAGIMARSVAECLALQQRARDRLDPAMEALLDNLELLAKRDFAGLKKVCGIDSEDLTDMIHEIRELNPKPGLAFGSEIIQPVVPDVFIREKPGGGWSVELNSETLPRVLVNSRYYTEVSGAKRSKKDKNFLSECLASANWLVKSLDQRARTILKVSSELVVQQEGFFSHGVEHLRPLNLKTIADAIEMHESTVSRVTANKYMATPRGIFELKYFFTSAIPASGGGDSHSAEAVRHRIRKLIDSEEAKAILSDDKLVDLLGGFGIDIARRTVAKYREAMSIPSSVQRRRLKNSPLI